MHMRSYSLKLAAAAGFSAGLFITFHADALTSADPAGIRADVEALGSVEAIHCRPYRHQNGHPYGFGCRSGGGASIEGRSGRDVTVHGRSGSREDTTVRSKSSTSTDTKSRTDTTAKTGTSNTTSGTSKTGTTNTASDGSKTESKGKTSGSTKSEGAQKQQ
jgi:hypothetical protein